MAMAMSTGPRCDRVRLCRRSRRSMIAMAKHFIIDMLRCSIPIHIHILNNTNHSTIMLIHIPTTNTLHIRTITVRTITAR